MPLFVRARQRLVWPKNLLAGSKKALFRSSVMFRALTWIEQNLAPRTHLGVARNAKGR
jgi:hypothetical protein